MSKEVPRLFTVPTDDMRRGIFANRITDPNSTTRAAFTGNAIPDARINSVSRAYLAYIPQANLPGAVNNYAAAPAEKNDNNQFNFKTNYRKGDKDDIAIRYSFFDVDGYQPYGYVPRTSGDVSLPGFGTFINQRSHNISITETHVFKANLIGELRLGYNRTGGGRIQENKDINFGGPLGIVGYPTDAYNFGLPKINGTTTNSFGDTTAVTSRNDNDIQTDLTLSWFAGRHNINIGGMYRRLQFNPLNLSTVRGQYFFEGGYTGDRFADFLLGLPSRATGSTGADKLYMRGNEYAAFIQDDFKLSRKLTLNLGLRYEYTSPLHEKYNQWSIIDFKNQRVIVASEGGKTYPKELWASGIETLIAPAQIVTSEQAGLDRSLLKKDRNNISPRFGFAFDVFGKQRTILRGGYGIFHNQIFFLPQSIQSTLLPFSKGANIINIPIPGRPPAANAYIDKILGQSSRQGGNTMSPDLITPYYQQWSIGIQQLITNNFLIEGQYMGSRGNKLYSYSYILSDPSPSRTNLANFTSFPNLGGFAIQNNSGDSYYHAGTLRIEKRLSRGLMIMGSYTYSKSIDTDSLGNAVSTSSLDQTKDKSKERGLSSFDIRHRVITSFTYDLPYKTSNKILTGLIGNWQVGGIITQQSGLPFSVNLQADRLNVGIPFGRMNLVGDANLSRDQRTPDKWFNTDAFVLQPVGSPGTAGRNIVNGPGTSLVDFSLLKNIPFSERHKLQFRTEVFNLFNHANFDTPGRICGDPNPNPAIPTSNNTGNTCSTPGFGAITSARDPRIIQFGLKYLF